MPKTKFQDVIFTIMMVIIMVYAMICYNIAISMGGLSNKVFLMAFSEMPIMCAVAFVLEFLVVGRVVKHLTFKTIDPAKTQPIFITLMISALTVCFMCPVMSFVASVLFNYSSADKIVSTWLQITVMNFPMAMFWQLCYAGPIVRKIFRTIFKKQLAEDK